MRIEKLGKEDLQEYCKDIGIPIEGKTKSELLKNVKEERRTTIEKGIIDGSSLKLLKKEIEALAEVYSTNLGEKIEARKEEMKEDNTDHYLIYRVLGITSNEGQLIDEYQNTGRFLYKYAGSFLEEAASLCLEYKNLDGSKTTVKNNHGARPKTFEIDFLDGKNAIEIKWRDATTDGDHITKEHTRVKSIESHGYTPIRVMFYYPQRTQAKRIQETLKTIYKGVKGKYYGGNDAWNFIRDYSGFDLLAILTEIADKRCPEK